MLFNSLEFAIFLPIVFLLYWFVVNKSVFQQNVLIVISSLIFYGWWDWRFLGLIVFSSVLDFSVGLLLDNEQNIRKRKALLFLSMFLNLGLLGVFKYFNFFLDNLNGLFSFLGVGLNFRGLDLVLPVGISFYTFQTMSYTIDVYRKNLQPTKSFISFIAYVSFFPQLVAGPIERAINLLPQFYRTRVFDYTLAINGVKQILWGLFKKAVIADSCAELANLIFNDSSNYSGFVLLMGAVFFSIQIYGDFSGYSDIAIGTARLFGFDLMQNFKFPYFSRDIAEFWRRWHISLSTWFRDYLYIPLGGSKGSVWKKVRNTFIIFLVSGFWHGANWTFIVWGGLNALYFLPLLLTESNRKNINFSDENYILPNYKEFFSILLTFILTVFAWIFFRADNITHAVQYIRDMFFGIIKPSNINLFFDFCSKHVSGRFIGIIFFFVIVEWLGRYGKFGIDSPLYISNNKFIRYLICYVVIFLILLFGDKEQSFIYFQF